MDDIRIILIAYLIAINLLGLILMGVDKIKAKRRKWRIPEATLFLVAAIGGSVGSIAGMYIFRHKTKHMTFKIGIPLIIFLQVLFIVLLRLSPLNFSFI